MGEYTNRNYGSKENEGWTGRPAKILSVEEHSVLREAANTREEVLKAIAKLLEIRERREALNKNLEGSINDASVIASIEDILEPKKGNIWHKELIEKHSPIEGRLNDLRDEIISFVDIVIKEVKDELSKKSVYPYYHSITSDGDFEDMSGSIVYSGNIEGFDIKKHVLIESGPKVSFTYRCENKFVFIYSKPPLDWDDMTTLEQKNYIFIMTGLESDKVNSVRFL